MIAFKNFTRTTFNLVLFLFSQCVTDRDLILGSSFSTLNTPYYRGKNKESNEKPHTISEFCLKRHFTIQKAVRQSVLFSERVLANGNTAETFNWPTATRQELSASRSLRKVKITFAQLCQ